MDIQQAITNLQLLDAIAKGNLSTVQELTKRGANIDYRNPHDKNSTPLHYAMAANFPEIVQFLLDQGANSEAVNDDGKLFIDFLADSPPSSAVDEGNRQTCPAPPMIVEQPTYFKRPGTASILGQLYESKLLALVLFRALHWEAITSFYLAANVDDAGAFDDLVLRYTDRGIDRLVFLQAKHQLGKELCLKDVLEQVKESGDFGLGKYFRSFLFIKLKSTESNKSEIFKNISKETVVEFVIYTTLKLNHKIPKEFDLITVVKDNEEGSLLYTCPTGRSIRLEGLLDSLMIVASKWYNELLIEILARYCFSKNEQENLSESIQQFINSIQCEGKSFSFLQICYENVPEISIPSGDPRKKFNQIKQEIPKILDTEKFQTLKMSDEDSITLAREFFSKLHFLTQQSSEAEVEQIIKNEIPNFYPVSGDVNLIFQLYHLAVQRWWLQTGDVPFQTKSSQLFLEAKATIERGSLLENLHLISMGKLQVYKNDLNPEKLSSAVQSEVQRFLSDEHRHMLPLVGGLIEGGCARLVEYLKSNDDGRVNFKFVNTDETNCKDKIGRISTEGKINDFLVFAQKEQIDQEVVDSLSQSFKKIILVSDKGVMPAKASASSSSSSGLTEYVEQVQENPAGVENDQDTYRNRRKAFLRGSRKSIRALLATMGEQLIDLNVNKK